MKILAHGLILGFAALAAIAPQANTQEVIANRYQERVQIISNSMMLGGCSPAAAEQANEVLNILDSAGAQGLVLYASQKFIVPASNAVRQSGLPSLYLVACNWRPNKSIMSVPYEFTLLGTVIVDLELPPDRLVDNPWVHVYRLTK